MSMTTYVLVLLFQFYPKTTSKYKFHTEKIQNLKKKMNVCFVTKAFVLVSQLFLLLYAWNADVVMVTGDFFVLPW